MISTWEVTWTVHVQPRIQCMIATWSVHDQLREQCIISRSCALATLTLCCSVCSARERREDVILNPPAIKKVIVCLFSAQFPWRHIYDEKRHLISWRSLEFTVPSPSIWLMHSCALAHVIPISEEPVELQREVYDQPRDQCMICHMISVWSSTWSLHGQSCDQCMI